MRALTRDFRARSSVMLLKLRIEFRLLAFEHHDLSPIASRRLKGCPGTSRANVLTIMESFICEIVLLKIISCRYIRESQSYIIASGRGVCSRIAPMHLWRDRLRLALEGIGANFFSLCSLGLESSARNLNVVSRRGKNRARERAYHRHHFFLRSWELVILRRS